MTGLSYKQRSIPFQTLIATTAEADEVRDEEAYFLGSPFTDGAEEVILGYQVARTLSGAAAGEAPSVLPGDVLVIDQLDGSQRQVTVAGVLAQQESLFGSSNAQVFVPLDPFYTIQRTSPSTGEKVPVYAGLTVIAVLVGVGTGVIAGFFPARWATKIQPVEALSYE